MRMNITHLGMEAQYRIIRHVREMIQDLENDLEETLTEDLPEFVVDSFAGRREIQNSLVRLGNAHSSEFNRLWDVMWRAIDGTLDYDTALEIYDCILD